MYQVLHIYRTSHTRHADHQNRTDRVGIGEEDRRSGRRENFNEMPKGFCLGLVSVLRSLNAHESNLHEHIVFCHARRYT